MSGSSTELEYATCRQCNGSGYGPDGGEFCETCDGKGISAIPDEGEIVKISPDRPVELVPEGQIIPADAASKLNLICPHCERIGVGPMGEHGPEWDPQVDVKEIIPVAPGSKYVILIPANTESEMVFQLQDVLKDWWEGPHPFLIAGDQFKLVKVDEHSEIPQLASCGADDCPGHTPGDPGGMCDDEEVETNGNL